MHTHLYADKCIYFCVELCVSDQMLLLAELSPYFSDPETEPTDCCDHIHRALLRMGRTAPCFTRKTSAIPVTHSLILFKEILTCFHPPLSRVGGSISRWPSTASRSLNSPLCAETHTIILCSCKAGENASVICIPPLLLFACHSKRWEGVEQIDLIFFCGTYWWVQWDIFVWACFFGSGPGNLAMKALSLNICSATEQRWNGFDAAWLQIIMLDYC